MSFTPFDQRNEADRLRRERAWREKAQPVVISSIQIPFWTLVWWLAGITAGVTLVHMVFGWLVQVLLALFAGESRT